MSGESRKHIHPRSEDTIRLLQDELAQTNRDVLALTLELDTRLEQLRAAEERYRRLAENAPDMIYRYDLRPLRGFTFVNAQAEAITGYKPQEYYDDPDLWFKIVHPDDRALLEPVLTGAREPGRIPTMRWRHKNGTIIWVEQHHSLAQDSAGTIIAVEAIARDVTSRKNLEEQFRQSQKMEAIGRLAGGVAHDFNNLLTVINGYSAQALQDLKDTSSLSEDLNEISKAGDRAAALTRQLLTFSRRQVLKPQVFDLNEAVAEMDRMLRRVVGEDVQVVTELAPRLGSICADRGGIEQVLMNLVVNARDAMPKGGKLVIETAEMDLDESYSREHGAVKPGRYVMLAVTDTGLGMDESTRARIFEPFFTTKPEGIGTGLGLSTVYGIVQQSGGSVWVYSEIGRGTSFKIYLPMVATASEAAHERSRAAKTVGGSETILVVDDEEGVRRLLSAVLRRAGYKLLEAANGQEALQLVAAYAGSIHLLISDVIMPGIGGPELAEKLAASRPDVKVLFMSGYTGASIAERGIVGRQKRFLQKPFTPASLQGVVRDTLDGK